MLAAAGASLAESEELDITAETGKVENLGIPTASSIEGMKEKADRLWDEQNYQEAAPAYSELAIQANWFANLVASVDEPYYSADSKSQSGFFSYSSLTDIALYAENTANSYKALRNTAMAREGMCYYYLQDYTKAVPCLLKALDLIGIKDEENWKMCADAMLDILELKEAYEAGADAKAAEEEAARKAEEEAAAAAMAAEREAMEAAMAAEEAARKADEEAAAAVMAAEREAMEAAMAAEEAARKADEEAAAAAMAAAMAAEQEVIEIAMPADIRTAAAMGFGGAITAHLTMDGSVIASLTIDAPDEYLGSIVAEDAFTGQFIGKAGPFAFGENGIDAVSGATVSSRGALEAINNAIAGAD